MTALGATGALRTVTSDRRALAALWCAGLLGLWAAEKLGKGGADAEAYAKSVVVADFEEAGDEDVVRKVKNDFALAGVTVADTEIRTVMTELLIKAADEIQAGR